MKVSIITVVYNDKDYIEQAIQSVLSQDYKNIEYILVDGDSDDGTLDIINKYAHQIHRIISEKDNGIYDAMNKGINVSTGYIVGILNSDDFYMDRTVISQVINAFEIYNADCLYADLLYVNAKNTDEIIRYWKSSSFVPQSFKKGWHPPHPTFFVKKSIYDRLGLYDNSLKVSADFELMLRFLEKEKINSYYLNKPLVKMRMGGESNKRIRDIIRGNINCYQAFKKNGLKVSIFYFICRLFPKLKQFFR